MFNTQLDIEEAIPNIVNRRFVAVSSTKGLGLFCYQLYVEGECVEDLVLDTGLSDWEVNEFRVMHVDIERHPNKVYLRSLERMQQSAKMASLG